MWPLLTMIVCKPTTYCNTVGIITPSNSCSINSWIWTKWDYCGRKLVWASTGQCACSTRPISEGVCSWNPNTWRISNRFVNYHHNNVVIIILLDIFAHVHMYIAPSDFTPISKDLTFEPFQTNQTVEVRIVSDGFAELTEQFSLVLTSEEENVLIQSGRSTLQVVITDQTGE